MAEVILTLVLRKLTDAAVRETLHLYGAGSKLDLLQHELRWIGAFLKDAESKRDSDARMTTWVDEVREVAYRIEDVINTFMAEADITNPVKLSSLVSEMDKIQKRLLEIMECTDKYGIRREELGNSSNRNTVMQRNYPVILPDEDDHDVIGLERDREIIVKLLIDPNTKKRRVVSIVGQGGLGKTTLARKVYNSIKVKEFEFRLWLVISQQFTIIDILKRILENIRSLQEYEKELLQKQDPVSQQRAKERFTAEVNKSLKEKQYLIVMDGVWAEALWDDVKVALPDVKNGSRVLITTRFVEVARRVDPTCQPYNLCYLSKQEGEQLLLTKAFPDHDYETYSRELSDLLEKFAKKCGGLPLALVVVGGLLSRTSPTFEDWYKIFEKISWQCDEGIECLKILATSYDELPIHLKPCFMYFAAFPEDGEIKAKSLIRIWIAEGFIPENDTTTMEETAEGYLEELVQRSMIQVSSRWYNGSINYCRIHDLLRDLTIKNAKENSFLEIISREIVESRSSISVRRLAIEGDEIVMKCTLPRLTTLLIHGDLCVGRGGGAFPLLKVLSAPSSQFIATKNHFKKSTQLRYIEIESIILIKYGLSIVHLLCLSDRNIFKPLSHARNLQTVDIRVVGRRGPISASDMDCIWGINTLRHVILPKKFYGPPSTAHIPNLQTLKVVKCRKSWITKGWPRMPNIRVLKIQELPPNYGKSFYIFLSGLHHLTSLQIYVPENDEMMDMGKFSCCNNLQSLCVKAKWNGTLGIASSFPKHLIKLTLQDSQLKEDPMPILEQLESLKVLVLADDSYKGRQLSCSAGRFPRLQALSLHRLQNLKEWKAEEGAMPMLKKVDLSYCRRLRLIPELRHMTSLTELTSEFVAPELERLLREELRNIREGTSDLTISIY